MTTFQTQYTISRKRSEGFATINEEESMTQQSDKNETDINILMQRFGATGQLPTVTDPAKFGDFTEAPDFRTAQDMLMRAREAFAAVPAKIRKQFDNDPAKFHEFVTNPDNLEEMQNLGLANKPKKVPTPPEPFARTVIDDNGQHDEPSQTPRTTHEQPAANNQPAQDNPAQRPSGQPRSR